MIALSEILVTCFLKVFLQHYSDLEDVLSDPGFWFMMLCFFIVVGDIAMIIGFANAERKDALTKTMPMHRERAKIVEKQQLAPNVTVTPYTLIWICVEFEDGKRRRLNVKAQSGLVVGDTGYLTWQGERVRNFEWDEKEKW